MSWAHFSRQRSSYSRARAAFRSRLCFLCRARSAFLRSASRGASAGGRGSGAGSEREDEDRGMAQLAERRGEEGWSSAMEHESTGEEEQGAAVALEAGKRLMLCAALLPGGGGGGGGQGRYGRVGTLGGWGGEQ